MNDKTIRLEITDTQFQALAKKKLVDVVALYDAVNSLTNTYPNKASLLNKFLSNETVDIIYHGGSSPGTKRRVVLQKINANGAFSAFCIESDASKSFKIEKAELTEK
ncbi:hypothetical protein [Shewanella sp.]|uniref:hypothetical protein n=1 Tax=Shewanella sp. TaxID=50422 RepID=UPI00404780E7